MRGEFLKEFLPADNNDFIDVGLEEFYMAGYRCKVVVYSRGLTGWASHHHTIPTMELLDWLEAV